MLEALVMNLRHRLAVRNLPAEFAGYGASSDAYHITASPDLRATTCAHRALPRAEEDLGRSSSVRLDCSADAWRDIDRTQ